MPTSRPPLQHPSSGTDTTRSGTTVLQLSSYTPLTTPSSPGFPRRQSVSGSTPPQCAARLPATATPPSRTNNPPALIRSHSSPPPSALHTSNLPNSVSSGPSPPVKATRFDRSVLHDHWARFKRTTGFGPPGGFTTTGTGTGSSSLDGSGGFGTDEDGRFRQIRESGGVRWGRVVARTITSDGDGSNTKPKKRLWGGRRRRDDDMEMGSSGGGNDHTVRWANVRRQTYGDADGADDLEDELDDAEVDAVVVDNQFLSLDKSTQRSQSTHPNHQDETGTPPTGPTGSASSSGVAESRAMVMLRYRIWPVIERFFSLHFHDPVSEAQYRKETFYTGKTLAFWAACFLMLNWILGAALLSKPYALPDKIFIFGVAPFLTAPLPVFITFDWPRTRPWIYQTWLGAAVWSWAFYNILFMHLCGVYGQPVHFQCGSRDFLVLFYYVTGLPVIAMFAMQQNRTVQTTLTVAFICTAGALLLPWKRSWIKHILNLIIFHAFILYINWMRETAERRLYVLRDQLKTQYKQTQKAQI
ncbi:hypothetical protein FRC09_011833, partial [Ceratobasidium sp. 395]